MGIETKNGGQVGCFREIHILTMLFNLRQGNVRLSAALDNLWLCDSYEYLTPVLLHGVVSVRKKNSVSDNS